MSNLFPLMAAAGNVETGDPTDANFENTVLLLNADGASDGGQNNTFRDVSGNAHTITRNGNVTQGSFSPFSQDEGKWGVHFDGNSDYLDVPNDASWQFGTGDYTLEGWIYLDSLPASGSSAAIAAYYKSLAGVFWSWQVKNNSGQMQIGVANTYFDYDFEVGQWYHVVCARNSGQLKAWANGEYLGSISETSNIPDNSVLLKIGVVQSTYSLAYSNYWHGYISNLRITKGTARYTGTSDITIPTAPYTDDSSNLLTCQSNRFIDNSSNDFSITPQGTSQVTPFSPFAQTTAYTQSVVNQGSVKFDGSGDYLSVPDDSSFAFGSGDFTVEAWIYAKSLGSYNGIIGQWLDNGATVNNSFVLETVGTNVDFYWVSGTTLYSLADIGAIPLNQWIHVAVARSGSSIYGFINGSLAKTGSISQTLNDPSSAVTVGGNIAGGGGWHGYIANARLVKGTAVYTADFTVPTEPLTDITNTSLLTCQANGFVDNSSNAHTITVNGNPERTTNVPFGERSVEFDGSGDYLSVADNDDFNFGSGDFTLEAWVYPETSGNAIKPIFNQSAVGASSNSSVFASFTTDYATFYISDGTGWDYNVTVSGSFGNQWSHVAWVRNGTAIYIYINGVQSGTTSIGSFTLGNSTLAFEIGAQATSYFDGFVSNARVVKGTAVYTANFTPPTEPLTAITNTSLLTCQNAVFQDNSGNAHAITANGNPQASTNLPFGERSVYFDGSGDGLSTSVGTSFNVGSGDFTIESFGYLTTTGQFSNILSAGTDSSNGYRLDINTSNNFRLLAYIGGSWGAVITGSTALTTGKWYHFAVTRSGNDFDLWIDGVSDATTVTNSGTIADPTTKIEVGAVTTNSLNRSFYGYLSNTRLVKGTAVYTAAFTPPTEPLTAVSGTSLLTCQDAVFQDNSGNAHAITVNGNAEASTNIPFAPVTTYGVQQYLDDAFTVSPQGGSGYFDGSGDYLSIPNSNDFAMGSDDFTLEAWVYPTSGGTNGAIFDYSSSTAATSAFDFRTAGTSANFYVRIGGTTYSATNTNCTLHQWHHVAAVRNGNSITVYVDGVAGTSTSISGSLNATSDPLSIGEIAGLYYYPGYIADARIIKGEAVYTSDFTPPTAPLEVLPNTSLLCNFTNASIVDATGKNVIETVGNAQVDTTTVKYGTGSMQFDGTGDYLVAPASQLFAFGTGDFTVEFWAYFDSITNYDTIYIHDGASGSLQLFFVSGKLRANNNLVASILDTTTTISTGQWIHFALCRSGSTIKWYLNGTEDGSTTNSTDLGGGTTNLTIGSDPTNSRDIDGYIDDLRITKGVARYTANFTPPTKALPVIGE